MSALNLKKMLLVGLGALALSSASWADEWNQRTVVTFGGPVEIPGQILPGGTYVFKLADSPSNRHVVQVFNQEETHVLGTFLAIPDYRLKASDKTIITFSERTGGSPDAIKAWFYPGHSYGHEFVYPKIEAVALAKANHLIVPAMPEELARDTVLPEITLDSPEVFDLTKALLKIETATGVEMDLIDDALGDDVADAPAPGAELPATLPETATSLPLIALLGGLSLGTAITIRFAAAKTK
jgi:hypothetical protein